MKSIRTVGKQTPACLVSTHHGLLPKVFGLFPCTVVERAASRHVKQQNWSFRVIFGGGREVSVVDLTLWGIIVSFSDLKIAHRSFGER
jgi:hypothetical protein